MAKNYSHTFVKGQIVDPEKLQSLYRAGALLNNDSSIQYSLFVGNAEESYQLVFLLQKGETTLKGIIPQKHSFSRLKSLLWNYKRSNPQQGQIISVESDTDLDGRRILSVVWRDESAKEGY